jgi:hypothetical protein
LAASRRDLVLNFVSHFGRSARQPNSGDGVVGTLGDETKIVRPKVGLHEQMFGVK